MTDDFAEKMPPREKPKPETPAYLNVDLPEEERKADFDARLEQRDNPRPADKFDPMTHDPLAGFAERAFKPLERQVPPKRLPTMGILPDKIRETQMVGMYLSKQELYLLIAHLSNRITDLEEKMAAAEKESEEYVASLEKRLVGIEEKIALTTPDKEK